MSERKGNEQRELRAYERFRNYIEKGEFQKAYRLFNREPGITDHMRLDEIPRYYQSLNNHLGKSQADSFKIGIRGAFKRTDDDCK